ncbi:Anthocyanidin 3-O-glucoside 2''-O-glucosyltransferase [Bertholletia excelsa]
MFPWFAMGHIIPFLHLSNRLSRRGHRVSFVIPKNTKPKVQHLNLHPDLITFIPLSVPPVNGLPPSAETTADIPCTAGVPYNQVPLLITAMDLTQPAIEASLLDLRPQFVFFDFSYWMPALARRLGIKSVCHSINYAATIGYFGSPARKSLSADFTEPPAGFPRSSIKLHPKEALEAVGFLESCAGGLSAMDRISTALRECDAISFNACGEMEGQYCNYVGEQFKRPVILAGMVRPMPLPEAALDKQWEGWLGVFGERTVIYCALGSECLLPKQLFRELVLGLELTGMPFLATPKPAGGGGVEAALPEGFLERTKGRGIVYGGWVPQPMILSHPAVGCFVTHSGSGSISEAMGSECQLVLIPLRGDFIVNARMIARDLKVGVEVEKGEDDEFFSREGVCKAIKMAMDEDSEVGKVTKTNLAKWREFLRSDGLESSYMDSFIQQLQGMLQ